MALFNEAQTTYIMAPTGSSSAWLERLVWDQEVAGSNPVSPTNRIEMDLDCGFS